MRPYRDVSEFFYMADVAKGSTAAAFARLHSATFSLYAAVVDTLRLPQLWTWLNDKIAR
jgi:hypothetical protein